MDSADFSYFCHFRLLHQHVLDSLQPALIGMRNDDATRKLARNIIADSLGIPASRIVAVDISLKDFQ